MANEYCIPERDTEPAKPDKSLIGERFRVDKFIHRIGYMYEPPMMMINEVQQEEKEILLKTIRGGLISSGIEQDKVEKAAKAILFYYEQRNLPMPTYKARGNVAKRKRNETGEDALWRRFWFQDVGEYFPFNKPLVKITGIKRCVTGRYYPPSGGAYYGQDYDYQPGGLAPACNHGVYEVKWYELYVGGYDLYEMPARPYVHPLDIQPLTEKEIEFFNTKKDFSKW